ncbi:Sin3 associated polypeptide p18-domain-containing protein [Aspergillus leporis]|uniref:Sin3 associated polypeptide p18-domain-containing protein n=1 Tax=Aspergillus leporis TaxID=41062 RepID=A0A5N5X4G7_9EURO|nr:Sin3 associated polypeptide p18-domain-containing protein [Aspergillus leporis]
MTAPRDAPKPQVDRQSTTPFHLKLFYRVNNFHQMSDFAPPSSPASYSGPVSGPNAIRARSPPPPSLPAAHLQIYTWQSCTLRELSQLLTSALPSLLPDPPVGTRLCFRLIYPDTKAAASMGPDVRGRYLSKDIGSVVIGPRDSPYRDGNDEESAGPRTGPLRLQGNDADKSLQDMRFVIGDYVDCAILPPLEDGSVAPPLTTGRGPIGTTVGGGMRAFRDNGFGGRPGRGGGRGGDRGIPTGDWRRGERLPEGGGRGRRGWAPY